jgi:hypothetical protein
MVKHFLLPLMKRKNNSKLNEGAQIPYRLEDFKEGDRVHVIGNFDDVKFDDLGTIVTTSNEIENPWSKEDSILIKFDEPKELEYGLHDGETGIREIFNKCDYRCWWIWLGSFIPNYVSNPDDYFFDERNRVIKLNDNLPSAYDVISSLYESTDLKHYIYPGIKVGDEVITSFGYKGNVFADNEMATVLDIDSDTGWILLKIKAWSHGHDGQKLKGRGCGPDDCFYVKDSDLFSNMVIRPIESLGLPDAYDVISSLYESTDLIKENLIYPGIKVGDEVIVSIGDEGITYGPIINNFATVVSVTEGGTLLVKLKNFNHGHDGNNNIHCGEHDCLFLNDSWYEKLSIRPAESLGMPDAYDVISSLYESQEDDLDWAMDMAKDIANKSIELTLIPKNKDKNFYLIYFDKPGITYETIQNILMYVKEETIWGNTLTLRDVESLVPYLYNNYLEKGFVYFSLKPNGQSGYGSYEESFSRVNNIKITAPNVKIIRPYPYGENINESDDFDWASDMVNDVNSGSLMTVIQKIPTTVDKDKFNLIVFTGPGITKKDITDVIMFTEDNTNYTSFFSIETIIDHAIRMYNTEGFLYINLRPSGEKSIGSSPATFEYVNKVRLFDDRVNVIKFNDNKKMNESEDLDWAMDMANNVNLAMTSIPTNDDGKHYVILFDKPGITYEAIESIVNYIKGSTVWYFTNPNNTISILHHQIKNGWSPYLRLSPGPDLNFGDDEDTFNMSTGLYYNDPMVKIIRPY